MHWPTSAMSAVESAIGRLHVFQEGLA